MASLKPRDLAIAFTPPRAGPRPNRDSLTGRNGAGQPDRHARATYSPAKALRWRVAGRDDIAVMANTRSEAKARLKAILGLAALDGLDIYGEAV